MRGLCRPLISLACLFTNALPFFNGVWFPLRWLPSLLPHFLALIQGSSTPCLGRRTQVGRCSSPLRDILARSVRLLSGYLVLSKERGELIVFGYLARTDSSSRGGWRLSEPDEAASSFDRRTGDGIIYRANWKHDSRKGTFQSALITPLSALLILSRSSSNFDCPPNCPPCVSDPPSIVDSPRPLICLPPSLHRAKASVFSLSTSTEGASLRPILRSARRSWS